jgi:hypothetical protein
MKYDNTLREDFQIQMASAADGELSAEPIAVGDPGIGLQLKP